MDNDTVVTLAAERSWPENDDTRFFRRQSDTLASFEPPHVARQGSDGDVSGVAQLPWADLDRHGIRLMEFAYFNRPYDWLDDPRRAHQEALLGALIGGRQCDLADWSTQQLWDILFAVARADRFMENTFAAHALALTTIANEIILRLLAARKREQQGDQPAWVIEP